MSDEVTSEKEKAKYDLLIDSKIDEFQNYLKEIDSNKIKESEIRDEIKDKKRFLSNYININFPIHDSIMFNGSLYQHPITSINFTLNVLLSQRYNEFEELHQKFLKGL